MISSSPSTHPWITAIEDNFPDYPLQQLGYHYDTWDVTPPPLLLEHDRLLHTPADALDDLPTPDDDLLKLAILHAHLRATQLERALAIALTILDGPRSQPAVLYESIALWAARSLASSDLEHAQRLLQRVFDDNPDVPAESQARLSAELLLSADKLDEAEEHFNASLGPSNEPICAERAYEITELYLRAGHHEHAQRWAQRCRDLAPHSHNNAILIDLALLLKTPQ